MTQAGDTRDAAQMFGAEAGEAADDPAERRGTDPQDPEVDPDIQLEELIGDEDDAAEDEPDDLGDEPERSGEGDPAL